MNLLHYQESVVGLLKKKVVRSKTVINNFLRFKDKYRNKNAVDRRKVLLNRGERGVLKLASTGKCSSKEIFQTIGLKMYKKIICNTVSYSISEFQYTSKLSESLLLILNQTFIVCKTSNNLGRQIAVGYFLR